MQTILPLIVLAMLSASAASAQHIREGKPETPGKSLPQGPPKPAANSCAEYGPGFVRIEGSSTCIKTGGSFGVGVGGRR